MSLTDGIILILAAGIVFFVVWRFISRIRRGETGCGCGCEGCSKACPSKQKKGNKVSKKL